MAQMCPGYNPTFQRQLVPTDPLGGLNCTCYSGAMAADDHTCGKTKTTGAQLRTLTGDRAGGTTLAQVDDVLRRHFSVDLDTRYRYTWAEFARRISGGASAILQGGYRVIRDSRFKGSESFAGNHAVFVPSNWALMDPLCDGRRAGIYKFHNEPYPQDLIRKFAASLNLEGRAGYPPKFLGDGFVYAAFTRDNEPAQYKLTMAPGLFDLWQVTNVGGRPTARRTVRGARTKGFTAWVTPPRLFAWPGHSNVSLVRLTSGSRTGHSVAAHAPRVKLEPGAGMVGGVSGDEPIDEGGTPGDVATPDPDLDVPEPANDAVMD